MDSFSHRLFLSFFSGLAEFSVFGYLQNGFDSGHWTNLLQNIVYLLMSKTLKNSHDFEKFFLKNQKSAQCTNFAYAFW